MQKLWKVLACALCAILLGTATVGCEYKQGGVENAEYTVDFNLPVTTTAEIKVLIPDNDVERKIMDALIAGFNEKYPLIKITKNFLTITNYNSTIVRQASAEVLPEIIWTNSSNYYFLISNGVALNLDTFTEEAEKAGVFDYDADFSEDFRTMGLLSGVRYAVPRTVDSVVTFYNTEILADAKVDMTKIKNGWTWDDLMDVCETLRKYYDAQGKTNYYPIAPNLTWESVAWPIIKSLGGELINENGEFALTEEMSNQVVAFVKKMVEKRYIPDKNADAANFESGTGALLFQSASVDKYENMASTKGKFNVVSFPLINGENSAIGNGFAGYAINKQVVKDQNKLNAACAFMAYLMSYDGQQVLTDSESENGGGLANPSIRNDLSVLNKDANWHKTYSSYLNLEAYTYGAQYKISQEFLANVKAEFTSDIVNALNTYVGDYAIRKSASEAYQALKGDIEEAFNSVV